MKSRSPVNENDLLLRLREGDEQAFELIYQKYSGRLFGNILRLLKDREAAEDILQEIFIRAWQHRAEIDTGKTYGSYLFTISKHLIYNYMRRASLEVQVAAYIAARSSEGYFHVEEQIHRRESDAAIWKAIEKLPPKRREVYIRCKIQGKSYREVAEELGCSVAAVNAHIVKATRTIGTQLQLTESVITTAICISLFQLI